MAQSNSNQVDLTQLDFKIDSVREHATALQYNADQLPTSIPLLERALGELNVALEELQVTQEELHAQADELYSARSLLNTERQRYHDLFEFAPEPYLVTDIYSTIREVNAATAQMLQVDANWLIGKPLTVYIAIEDKMRYYQLLQTARFGKQRQSGEFVLRPRNGTPRHVELVVRMVMDDWSRPNERPMLRWLIHDISTRKQTESELAASRDQLRQLSLHTERIREDERTRIARELHDELGGGLTGLKLHIGSLMWGRETDTNLMATLNDVAGQLDNLVETVRRIGSDLRPPLLDDLGLLPAMEWHASAWQKQTGIPCVLDLLDEDPPLNIAQRTAIFRVFQEALTNVARHAHASRVAATMAIDSGTLVLCIEDEGMGIDLAAVSGTKSLGLMGMQERIREVGGALEIEGRSGQGTTVEIRLPLRATQTPVP